MLASMAATLIMTVNQRIVIVAYVTLPLCYQNVLMHALMMCNVVKVAAAGVVNVAY